MIYKYHRRPTHTVTVGNVHIGSRYPIVVQSMTTTPTEDTERSAAQAVRIAAAGGALVRLTAQGRSQAENLGNIRTRVRALGYDVPLVADIHFTSELAMIAARQIEKVRINPGNFVDKRARFEAKEITEREWNDEKMKIQERFVELIDVCRTHGTALRIGVNHGSLSDRVMSRYGNTPQGMVVSAMEFLEVCRREQFDQVVVSMKSSNVRVMIESYRQLADAMEREGMTFPLHLGVTEAGEGQQGRVRSGVGIGTLLAEGLGDTIRVSLTEEPECEIPAARLLADYLHDDPMWQPTDQVSPIAGLTNCTPIVVATTGGDFTPQQADGWLRLTVDQIVAPSFTLPNTESLQIASKQSPRIILTSGYKGADWSQSIRQAISILHEQGLAAEQIVIQKCYPSDIEPSALQICAAADFGGIFADQLAGGIWIETEGEVNESRQADTAALSLDILQAARVRISTAEIISCPGCGRTLYDLQNTVRQVKERFAHRKGLKLAVMGCIVNGPGEMADAEFGYVGSGPGLVTLYHGTQVVERNIPQEQALDKLEEIIDREWNRS